MARVVPYARARRRAVVAACVLCAGAFMPGAHADGERRVEWTDVALVEGRVVSARELRTHVVVVEVWATWCPFCKKQNPHIQRLHQAMAGKGLTVLTFAVDEDEAAIRDYQRRYGYTFAVARYSSQVERWFGRRRSLPELYVVDRSGRVVLREEGEMFPEEVAALARFAAGS